MTRKRGNLATDGHRLNTDGALQAPVPRGGIKFQAPISKPENRRSTTATKRQKNALNETGNDCRRDRKKDGDFTPEARRAEGKG